MARLLPGQLRSAESTADLAQHATRVDKYRSMSAMPTTEPGLVSLHCIPKAEGTAKRCSGCAPGCKSSWEHGVQADATRSIACVPQHAAPPYDLCALLPCPAGVSSVYLHCAKSNETLPQSWGLLQTDPRGSRGASPGLSWPEPRMWAQNLWLHPPYLFTETPKHPYTKTPTKPSGTKMINASLQAMSDPHCPSERRALSPVDMHVATSH